MATQALRNAVKREKYRERAKVQRPVDDYARDRLRDDQSKGDDRQGAPGQREDQERPDQVKLLFHRQRPQRPHGLISQPKQLRDVARKEEGHEHVRPMRPVDHGEDRDDRKDQRQDAQRAAQPKIMKIGDPIARVQENAGNQKAGKHEEEIHAEPAVRCNEVCRRADAVQRARTGLRALVREEMVR
jgi:hypothetical protein